MVQTSNRFFDEIARLMNDATGVAQGVRREFDTLFRTQAERIMRDLDVVKREEFEAVKEMAQLAREENDALKARIVAAPAIRAPWMTDRPTPPAPITATLEPGFTLAVLIAAPIPVIVPQPTKQARSSGTSSRIFIVQLSGTTASSAKVEA